MSGEPVLTIRDLNVRFRLHDGEVHAVKDVDLDVARGETVAIVGESGFGQEPDRHGGDGAARLERPCDRLGATIAARS